MGMKNFHDVVAALTHGGTHAELRQNVIKVAPQTRNIFVALEAARRGNNGNGWHGITNQNMRNVSGAKEFDNGDGSINDGGFDNGRPQKASTQ
jgi:hypothetical protein